MNLEGIFELTEEILKREVKLVNNGKLPDIAYVNGTPLYLQEGEHYSWDKLGEKPLGKYSALDTVDMFLISPDAPLNEAKK